MNKTAIKNFAIWARNKLIADVKYRAGLLGVTENGIANALPQSTGSTEFYDIGTAEPFAIHGSEIEQRRKLVEALRLKEKDSNYQNAYKYILEEVSAPKKYEKLKNNLVFTVLEDGTIVSDNQDVSFDINGLTINVYNTVPVVVPDTLSVTYLTIIIGILLIGVGGFILYKKGYEKI